MVSQLLFLKKHLLFSNFLIFSFIVLLIPTFCFSGDSFDQLILDRLSTDKKILNLSGANIGPREAKVLAEMELLTSVETLLLQGNKLSKGTGIVGDGIAATETFALYLGKLPMIVRPHWILPSYLLDKDLKCRIRIYLSENGKLLRSNIFETSGNIEYDNKALLAVKKASPFPELAENIKKRGIDGDIVLGFPL